jgi:hypothetical protein
MPKSIDSLSQIASRLIRSESTQTPRHATTQLVSQVQTRNRLARSATQAMTPLLQSNPLVRASIRTQANERSTNSGLVSLDQSGTIRSYSNYLPPTTLITRYKPILEEAVAKQQELVELVEQNNFCLPSFVTIALNLFPGISSIRLDNGYIVTGVKEIEKVENTTARRYQLEVTTPDTLDRLPEKVLIPVTVMKANVIADARPSNIKTLMGLCSAARSIHQGDQPEHLDTPVRVFSTTFTDLEALYSSYDVVRDLIETDYVSTASSLFEAIGNRLKANGIKTANPFVAPLKQMLIEQFKARHPGHEDEIKYLLKQEAKANMPLFNHSIEHKGGAYRAAFKLNLMAKANPNSNLTAMCVATGEKSDQHFNIVFKPRGYWVEQTVNPETGVFENKPFAKPEHLSEALKQRQVRSILMTESLGIL